MDYVFIAKSQQSHAHIAKFDKLSSFSSDSYLERTSVNVVDQI